MDKDSKGLLKYFSILIFTILFSPGIFIVSEILHRITKIYDDDTAIEILIITILIGILTGFLVPVIITIRAICTGWSRHLNRFFNKFILPTAVFIVLFTMVYSTYLFGPIFNLTIRTVFILIHFLFWAYCGVYLVIIINNTICLMIRLYRKIFN